MDRIHLLILTAQETLVDTLAEYVNVPTEFGSLGILSGHESMLCAMADGLLRCRFASGETLRVQIGSGMCRVENNEVTALVRSGRVLE